MHFRKLRASLVLVTFFPAILITTLTLVINPTQLSAAPALATGNTITVNTTADELNNDGDCSLREAVEAANIDGPVDGCTAGNGDDTINVPTGTYILSLTGSGEDSNQTGDLDILDSVTIKGNGAASSTINGLSSDRIIHVNPSSASNFSFQLEGIRLTNGEIGNGAGIYLNATTARLLETTIDSHTAITNGGGIYIDNSILSIESNTEIATNLAAEGAGIYANANSQLEILDSWLHHNIASNLGGGAWVNAGNTTVRNSLIEHNRAQNDGGGLYSDSNILVEDSEIQFNAATSSEGGAFYLLGGSLIIRNSLVYSNTSGTHGGAIYQDTDGIHVQNTIFRDNESSGDGGAIYFYYDGGTTIEESLFEGNKAANGGAILIYEDGSLSVERSTFISNTATTDGGAIYISESDYGYATIRNSTLTNNSAGDEGGAVYSYFLGTAFENSTVVNNSAGNRGGGFASPIYFGYFFNTILAGNRAASGEADSFADCYAPNYNLHSAGNNLFGQSTGCQEYRYDFTLPVGTIFTAVLNPLADNGGGILPDGTHPQSYSLMSGSPAIDAGNDDFCPLVDQSGAERTNGNSCDLGALESSESAAVPTFTHNIITVDTTADDNTVNGNCTLREAIESAENDTAVDGCAQGDGWDTILLSANTYSVTLGRLTIITEHVTISGTHSGQTTIHGNDSSEIFYIANSGGLILHNLTVAHGYRNGGGGCIEGSYNFLILIDTIVTNCVSTRDGGALYSYGYLNLTRSTISNNRATGINSDGGGIYNYYGMMFVKDSQIISNTASINGGGVNTYVGLARISSSQISSNTITHANGAGGGIEHAYGTLILDENSQVNHNYSAGNCGGVNHRSSAALIEDSTISYNETAGYGGGICAGSEGGWMLNSLVEHNTAGSNGGGLWEGGLIESSTVRHNTADSGSGGGIFINNVGAIVETSTLYGNSSGWGGGIATDDSVTLNQVTLSENSAITSTGGISISSNGKFLLKSSIIANSTRADCTNGGIFFDGGYNLIESGECLTDGSSLSGNPLLTAAADVITGEVTLKLQIGSPVIDLIPKNTNGCGDIFRVDQRGHLRPYDGDLNGIASCDIGAVEAQVYQLDAVFSGLGGGTVSGMDTPCTSDCSERYLLNETVTLTATADGSSIFTGWSGGCSGTGVCALTIDGHKTVTATFTLQTFDLTASTLGNGAGTISSNPSGISCTTGSTGDCSETINTGTIVTLTATPDTGSEFSGWSGSCTGTADCVVTIDEAKSVTATFTLLQYAVTVSTDGTGNGQAAVSPTTSLHNYGSVVTVTATADTGSSFTNWSGDISGSTNPMTLTVDGAKSVTATFTLNRYTVNTAVSGTGSGSISKAPDAADYDYGSTVTLTATADIGSTFTGWSGSINTLDNPISVTVDEAKSITGTFTLGTNVLAIIKPGNGDGTVSSDPAGISCGVSGSGTCALEFNYNTVVTLTATADGSSIFTGWSGSGCSGSGICTVTMDQVQAVSALFTLKQYSLTTMLAGEGAGTVRSNPNGISCGVSGSGGNCTADFDTGTVVTLTATAGAESVFAGWSGACSGMGSCTVTLNQAKAVTATFDLNRYTVTTSVGGTGSGALTRSPNGGDYPFGSTVTLTATADVGSTFSGWSGDVNSLSNPLVVTVDQAKSITGTFTLGTNVLAIIKPGNGDGTVSSDPAGINCGINGSGTCALEFDYNTVVTLTATADGDSIFTGWSGSGCSGTATCTVTMDQVHAVSALFALKQFSLTTTLAGEGAGRVGSSPSEINCGGNSGGNCTADFDTGTVVTLTATAGNESVFTGWLGACNSSSNSCVVTIDKAKAVTATFALNRYTAMTSFDGSGSGTISRSPDMADYAYGSTVTFTATADVGSTFTGWSGDVNSLSNPLIVTIDQAKSITATFTLGTNVLTVIKDGTGSGAISSDPAGINCGVSVSDNGPCALNFDFNTVVTLTATADIGSIFTGWAGACSGTDDCIVTMDEAKNVTATFTSNLPEDTIHQIYLPVLVKLNDANTAASAPDLVVQDIIISSDDVQVVILNQGNTTVKDPFWVDLYINPTTPPTMANHIWGTQGDRGAAWGAVAVNLAPGKTLTLNLDSRYLIPSKTDLTGGIPAGATLFAQVDSANVDSPFGAIAENHELLNGPYNNIIQMTAPITMARE